MKEFIKIGEQLKAKKEKYNIANKLKYLSISGYNENTCEEIIQLCLIAEIECISLIEIMKTENKMQCIAVLTAAV